MRSFVIAALAALAFAGAASATDTSSPGLWRHAMVEAPRGHPRIETRRRCHANGRDRPCPVHGIRGRPHPCGFNQICNSRLPHL